eukprot:1161113-Pelagomonas_calceolata.AAC.2
MEAQAVDGEAGPAVHGHRHGLPCGLRLHRHGHHCLPLRQACCRSLGAPRPTCYPQGSKGCVHWGQCGASAARCCLPSSCRRRGARSCCGVRACRWC